MGPDGLKTVRAPGAEDRAIPNRREILFTGFPGVKMANAEPFKIAWRAYARLCTSVTFVAAMYSHATSRLHYIFHHFIGYAPYRRGS